MLRGHLHTYSTSSSYRKQCSFSAAAQERPCFHTCRSPTNTMSTSLSPRVLMPRHRKRYVACRVDFKTSDRVTPSSKEKRLGLRCASPPTPTISPVLRLVFSILTGKSHSDVFRSRMSRHKHSVLILSTSLCVEAPLVDLLRLVFTSAASLVTDCASNRCERRSSRHSARANQRRRVQPSAKVTQSDSLTTAKLCHRGPDTTSAMSSQPLLQSYHRRWRTPETCCQIHLWPGRNGFKESTSTSSSLLKSEMSAAHTSSSCLTTSLTIHRLLRYASSRTMA